jgi:hypothetical protein
MSDLRRNLLMSKRLFSPAGRLGVNLSIKAKRVKLFLFDCAIATSAFTATPTNVVVSSVSCLPKSGILYHASATNTAYLCALCRVLSYPASLIGHMERRVSQIARLPTNRAVERLFVDEASS